MPNFNLARTMGYEERDGRLAMIKLFTTLGYY